MSIDRRSRHATAPRIPWRRADGSEVRLVALAPRAPRPALFAEVATDSDRLDTLADRYYRDPEKLWKIADASPEPDPFDAVAPGAAVAIPPDK